ncbi:MULTISPECIES: tyrosine-type recombinase/integrase [Pseudomonas]|uniref:Site-specific recombinase, phage integrase family n=2 Tax=Pseudomonas TaxID=286 RepID=Q88EP5_PSEPK|nr:MULTISPECIES: tyrosine-type recombinase/integrase [Pseudomonas]AAN69986.1 Site-specific recombinase, phage integrase family [Pseudomonas putida KT2440]MDD2081103.1 site-specific integrase [Pseudomonas putida]PXZ47486.1 hypothetical protein DM483_20240 [Pseudomonas sp. SMT-1]QDW56776.1 phage integrase family protein [Pseudomonas sp. KBS0802]QXZ07019.1 tyrosine-type recombinase/integrase [Pseudomonas putida]
MLTNFFYTKSIYLGKEHHIIRYMDEKNYGRELPPLSLHLRDLINQGYPDNSIKDSGLHNANFIDFFEEGLKHIEPSKSEVNTLYREYHSYLTVGSASNSTVVRKICEAKPSPMVSTASSKKYHAQVQPFLKSLGNYFQKYKDYCENGLVIEKPETTLLIESLMKITPTTIRVREREKVAARQQAAPMTAATGNNQTRASYSSHIPYENNFCKPLDEDRYFPLDKVTDLITKASCYRNSCFYALIAATNARNSEADQILWRDINFTSREVFLVNPHTRLNPGDAYRGLSEIERNKLEWKGRGTPLTIMLEPYASLFFHYLELYILHEYQPSCGHNFVFHCKSGRPQFLCDYSTVVLHQFKNAAKRALPNQQHLASKLGLHSLRHSNIFFLKNYLEHSQGQGLTDSELLLITGHADIRSLQKYAKVDRELLLEKIAYGNSLRKNGNIKSSTEFQIQYLEERLAMFKEKLKQQNNQQRH